MNSFIHLALDHCPLTLGRLNTKATLRVQLERLQPILPEIVFKEVLKSRYHAAKSNSLVIQADESRTRTQNVESCHEKLHGLILEAASNVIRGETLPEQSQRVRDLYGFQSLYSKGI